MRKLFFALLLATLVASVQTEPAHANVPVQPSTDSAEHRKLLRDLMQCLAEVRPRWARQTLAEPYLSDDQARVASQALDGRDNCLQASELEMTFRTSSVVASLAEHFLRSELARVDFARLATALNTLPPLNVSEDFALCVAAAAPAAARDLALSEPGSDAEVRAARELERYVPRCVNEGERLTVDLQALRALVAVALYRGMTSVTAARN